MNYLYKGSKSIIPGNKKIKNVAYVLNYHIFHGSNNALHIHEIRHVALSLDSEKGMVFNSKDLLKPTTQTGKLDEIEGYKAQYGYSGNGPGEAESEDGIVENIANLKDKSGNYICVVIRLLLDIGKRMINIHLSSCIPILCNLPHSLI